MVMFLEAFIVCKGVLYFLYYLVPQTSLSDWWGIYNCLYLTKEEIDTHIMQVVIEGAQT